MATLERRISALEGGHGAQQATLFVGFVSANGEHRPLCRLVCGLDEWVRQSGESDDDFRRRAANQATRTPWGMAVLMVALGGAA